MLRTYLFGTSSFSCRLGKLAVAMGLGLGAGCAKDNLGKADLCPLDADKMEAGICGCGVPDTDSDGDGSLDCLDGCPDDATKTDPGACGCNVSDVDSDGDGAQDCLDGCPADGAKMGPMSCGCGVAELDDDSDGTANCVDGCAEDSAKTAPGDCGCGEPETDSNNNGIADCIENTACPGIAPFVTGGPYGGFQSLWGTGGQVTITIDFPCPVTAVTATILEPDNTGNQIIAYDGATQVASANFIGDGVTGVYSEDTQSVSAANITRVELVPDPADYVAYDALTWTGGCMSGAPADCMDYCPNDDRKTDPGACGCGVPDIDTDGDGAADCTDLCPADDTKLTPGQCGCGVPEGTCTPRPCIPDGEIDDTLGVTDCCSGRAVSGSTYCAVESDWGTTWASCGQICGGGLVTPSGSCIPSGRIDDHLGRTTCCSGAPVANSMYCVNPGDQGTTWTTCLELCQ